jgi:carbonic anhydrase/acetyltransferase-like protein (isoleucine patch superfamily)
MLVGPARGSTSMPIYSLESHSPQIDPSAWVAPSATLIGQVVLAEQTNIWFNVVIRGDNDWIRIGARSNVQEHCVLHTDPGFILSIGTDVTVGHQAMLHGCTIGDGSLIGIQAIVLNGARVGKCCLIGAGSLIAEGKEIPDRSLVMGTPGKVIRTLTDDEVARLRMSSANYVERAKRYAANLRQRS